MFGIQVLTISANKRLSIVYLISNAIRLMNSSLIMQIDLFRYVMAFRCVGRFFCRTIFFRLGFFFFLVSYRAICMRHLIEESNGTS